MTWSLAIDAQSRQLVGRASHLVGPVASEPSFHAKAAGDTLHLYVPCAYVYVSTASTVEHNTTLLYQCPRTYSSVGHGVRCPWATAAAAAAAAGAVFLSSFWCLSLGLLLLLSSPILSHGAVPVATPTSAVGVVAADSRHGVAPPLP